MAENSGSSADVLEAICQWANPFLESTLSKTVDPSNLFTTFSDALPFAAILSFAMPFNENFFSTHDISTPEHRSVRFTDLLRALAEIPALSDLPPVDPDELATGEPQQVLTFLAWVFQHMPDESSVQSMRISQNLSTASRVRHATASTAVADAQEAGAHPSDGSTARTSDSSGAELTIPVPQALSPPFVDAFAGAPDSSTNAATCSSPRGDSLGGPAASAPTIGGVAITSSAPSGLSSSPSTLQLGSPPAVYSSDGLPGVAQALDGLVAERAVAPPGELIAAGPAASGSWVTSPLRGAVSGFSRPVPRRRSDAAPAATATACANTAAALAASSEESEEAAASTTFAMQLKLAQLGLGTCVRSAMGHVSDAITATKATTSRN